MKDITHLVLDFENKNTPNVEWSLNFISDSNLNFNIVSKKHILKHKSNVYPKSNILINYKKFTTLTFDKNTSRSNSGNEKFDSKYFMLISKTVACYLNNLKKNNVFYYNYNDVTQLVNINFLRKERLYTKLKYSRSPAYDIVSGGAAALLAGFIGFLISEKYGFELVDSGDFYYLFMYGVWVAFSIRPLLTSISMVSSIYELFSFNFIMDFYKKVFYLLLKKLKG